MARESAFGAEPEQLRELLSFGLEDSSEKEAALTTSLGTVFERPSGQIGRYKLLSILGEGGMGIVYLAEQEQPIKRQMALKVIKPGMDSARVIARFEAERQALALLDHPNIAHVYDAGTTESGRPYFVMEYVEGLPITEHCDRYKLTIDERLKLFLQVCHAVHHAHQKGIIHRDIKPSNILVSTQDEQVVPKIIDFGVAKAIAQPLSERTLYTEQGQLFGTPEYMSPEQADMATEDIDTRSDIYSLGVLLYVLLTGVLPFEPETLREGGIEQIRKMIRETDPKTPSTRLTKLGEAAEKIAESRRTKIETLARRLHRELEWIPLKAMRKERTERYRSASELADDIENYLRGNPLIAGPLTAVYRFKKFVRRNRAFVTGIAAVLAVLVAGVIISMSFAVRAERARAEAQAVSDFLTGSVLDSFNLRNLMGKEITVRSILDATSQKLEGKFQDQPLVEASVRYSLVSAYGLLGLFEPAELHAKRVIEIRRTELGTEHIDTVISALALGWLYMLQGRCYEAEPLLSKALPRLKLALGEGHFRTLHCMSFLGWVYNYQGRFREAEELLTEALAAAHRAGGTEHGLAPLLLCGLGFTHRMQGRYEEAERLYLSGLEMSRRVRGERDQDTLSLMHSLGELRWDQGRYDEAEKLLHQALAHRREVWGEEHSETLQTMATLGLVYHSQGRYEEAESLFVKALDTSREVLGEAHFATSDSMYGLGELYLSRGRYDEAEVLLTEAWDTLCTILGEENWYTLRVMNTLAKVYEAQERYRKADSLFNETLKSRLSKLGPDHPDTLESKNDLAVLYTEQGDYDRAEALLLEAVEGRRLKLGDTHPHTIGSRNNLIDLYEAWGQPEQADKWRAKLHQKADAKE
jgi:non-specific serine/threonine protein kinase/serine/threonine-protein kinase